MSSRSSWTGLRLLAILVPVSVAACSGSAHPGDAGQPQTNDAGDAGAPIGDAGDAGIPVVICGSIGASCTTPAGCCGNLACTAGLCAQPAAICAGYAEPCITTADCCAPPGDAGRRPLSCVTLDAGLALCLSGSQGSGCLTNDDCANPLACLDGGACDYPLTGASCVSPTGICQPGDDCSGAYNAIINADESTANNGTSVDPCFASGLNCTILSDLSGNEWARCLTATISHPPAFPSSEPPLYDDTLCNPVADGGGSCASDSFAAPRSAPVCGNFFFSATDDSHCLESCRTGDDCDSVAWDCVQGSCKPNYCYAGIEPDGGSGTVDYAALLSPYQVQGGGLPISGDPHVLFNPCALDAGFATACLPQYDALIDGSSGICVRIGGPDAGGFGAACDPNPYRNAPGGLCQAGTYCDKGTCLPWCDLGTKAFVQCPQGLVCSRLPAGGPIASSGSGTTNSLGVCAQSCDPYQSASNNSCTPFVIDGGTPALMCKFSESQNDILPSPGICVAGVAQPVPVGSPCAPFGWVDPCVSGAQCSEQAGDGGIAFVCAQLCDPQPSPTVVEPSCAGSKTCVAFQTCDLETGCAHEGVCQ